MITTIGSTANFRLNPNESKHSFVDAQLYASPPKSIAEKTKPKHLAMQNMKLFCDQSLLNLVHNVFKKSVLETQ